MRQLHLLLLLPLTSLFYDLSFLGFFLLLSASEVELEIVGWTGSDSFFVLHFFIIIASFTAIELSIMLNTYFPSLG